MATLRILLMLLVGSVVTIMHSHGYRIIVGALEEDCYFDKVEKGTKIGLIYEVLEGGFLDIDLLVTKPKGDELFLRKGESSGKATFTAPETGTYKYCFSNRMSTVTPKEVKFSVEISTPDDKRITEFGNYTAKELEEIQPEKLEGMISELRSSIYGIRHEQEYVEVRDRIHGRIQEATNLRYTLWAFFETNLVVIVSVGQVVYIKRFFEVRRMV